MGLDPEKIKEAAALVALEGSKRECPLYFYTPSRAIVPFHASRCIIRQLVGANRTGKTESLAAEGTSYGLGYRLWVLRKLGLPIPEKPWIRPTNLPEEAICFNGAGIRVSVPNTGLFISGLPMKKGIGEILSPKIRKYLAPFIEKEWAGHAGVPARVQLKNGSIFHYGSDEQDRMAHEGTAYHWIKVDEPIKKSTYVALRRGSIDNFAPISFSYTPLGPNAAWMFRDLYAKRDDKRIFALTATIWDNDYLSREAIEEFANDPAILEIEKEARLYGRFQNLIDRIYPEVNEDVHIIPPFTPPSDWYIGHFIDPHTIKPWAQFWVAVSPRGDLYVFREHPTSDFTKIRRDPKSYDDYNTLIRRIEGDTPSHIRFADPNYGPRKDVVRGIHIESVVSEMEKRGLSFNCQLNDDLAFGEGRVHALLHYDTSREVDSLNRPRLFVTENCINARAALAFYSAKTIQGTDNIPDETKRDETFKDFADLFRYLAVSPLAQMALSDAPLPYDYSDYSNDSDSGSYLD